MNLLFLYIRKNEPGERALLGEHAAFTNPEPHTDEGSEFLDDLIRRVEQPLIYLEDR